MLIAAVGLNHRTAPLAVRERLVFPETQLKDTLRQLVAYDGVASCVLISTCNRTELYAAVSHEKKVDVIWRFLAGHCGRPVDEMHRYGYQMMLGEAVEHLFQVAAGLDSMVLGETQILGQVKTAYQIAQDAGTVNGLMNLVFQQTLAVGKRVRAETGIDRNPVSISYAAVELARQVLGSLEGRTVLIVGAGEMSELTVRHLLANGVSGVIVSNRSFPRAQALAEQFGGQAVYFDELYDWMEKADIVISATAAAHYVIKPEPMSEVMRRRENRAVFMIDIAVPRDIESEVGRLPGVALYDIDSLQSVVDANLAERRRAAAKAEAIIAGELEEFLRSLSVRHVVPTVAALKRRGDEIKSRELQKAFNRLGEMSEHEVKVVSTLANSIVNQLLHEPVTRLKAYAVTDKGSSYAEALQKLFDLESDQDEANMVMWTNFRHRSTARG